MCNTARDHDGDVDSTSSRLSAPTVAFDVAGRPYCTGCAGMGAFKPCSYHQGKVIADAAAAYGQHIQTLSADSYACLKCGGTRYSCPEDFFVRNMVRCVACGTDYAKRDLWLGNRPDLKRA